MLTYDLFFLLLHGVFLFLLIGSVIFQLIRNDRLRRYLYISLSIICILMAMFRPFGTNKDASNYEIHAEQTCKLTECESIQVADYDVGYFLFLSAAKVFFDGQQAILCLAGLALAIKLFVIARITSYSVLSLYFYFCVLFLTHDVSALRVSMALAFYLLALYLITKERIKSGVIAYGVAMLTHFQAAVAPMAQLMNAMIGRRYWLAIILVVVSQLAVVSHLAPVSLMINLLMSEDELRLSQNLFVDSSTFEIKTTNVLIIMLLLMTVFPLKRTVHKNMILGYCFSSVVVGYMFYWLFTGVPIYPDRIVQFFWVPLSILVSLGKFHSPTFVTTIMVGVMFFLLNTWYAPIIFQ